MKNALGPFWGCWGLEVIFEVTKAKFWISSIFNEFWFRTFVILGFEVVWPRWFRRPQKEPSECFQKLYFWNQWVLLIKMHFRVRYSLDFDLKIRSGQVWASNFRWKIFLNFVAFSEYPNFNITFLLQQWRILNQLSVNL